jgi:sulfur carrier protein
MALLVNATARTDGLSISILPEKDETSRRGPTSGSAGRAGLAARRRRARSASVFINLWMCSSFLSLPPSQELYISERLLGEMMKIALPRGSPREMAVENARIEDILRELGINPVEVIVARNGVIVSEEETAGSGDELKIVRIVHGG